MANHHGECREEQVHPVTFAIAESTHNGAARFQARVTLDGIVFQDIGRPQRTELDAFDEIGRVFASRRRSG